MDLREQRDLVGGFGDSFSRAIEFVAVPVLLGFIGHKLDGALGTRPLLLIGLTVFAIVGMFIRAWYAYGAEMTKAEEDAPWRRR